MSHLFIASHCRRCLPEPKPVTRGVLHVWRDLAVCGRLSFGKGFLQ